MFGYEVKLKCPYCGYRFKKLLGITSYYKIKTRNDDATYHKEYCTSCGKLFLANGESSEKMVNEEELEHTNTMFY